MPTKSCGIFRRTLETGEPHIVPERIEERLRPPSSRSIYEWQINRIPLPGEPARRRVLLPRHLEVGAWRARRCARRTSRKDEFLATLVA